MPTKTEAKPKAEEAAPQESIEVLAEHKMQEAADIVRRKMYYSVGVGLVPIPLLDMATMLAMQIYMVKQLADVFETPFSQARVRSIIYSLLGSVLPVGLAGPLASTLKMVPVVGYTTSAVAMSITCGASTYALGKIFTNHFAMGGTIFDFNSEKMKSVFAERFKEGKDVASEMKAEA